ncbi:hypothetical protein OED01_13930 [Microbacterium sp. M28]|uniref:hypothetical protein n=1 Tax=Microbacterium sp. M28 TaxID=2962064 RepID=UPI0021F4F6AC|nr:hypothetical protein [Microbacterium sp. M28]UYO96687.1 hypothetical protein OED01_13930 [Microbacterium sp. M28]
MPRPSDLRLAAIVLTVGLLVTGCSSSSSAPAATGAPSGGPATPTPVPTPEHLDLEAWDPESGNGIDLLDGPSARAVVLSAIRGAGPVAMSGTFSDARGRSIRLAVHGSNSQTVARFDMGGGETVVVVDDGRSYVRPSATTAAAWALPADVYSCVADDSPAVTQWGPLLHPLQTVSALTADAVALGQPADGEVDLLLGPEGTLGALHLHAVGAPLPLSLTRADPAGTLDIAFAGWGEEIEMPDLGDPAGC